MHGAEDQRPGLRIPHVTRRRAYVAQNMIVSETDCGTTDSIEIEALVESESILEPFRDRNSTGLDGPALVSTSRLGTEGGHHDCAN